jgi:hypothetical protein
MAKRSALVDDLVRAIGYEATQALIKGFGGKQVRVPDGSGRDGAFCAWLDEQLGTVAAAALKQAFGGERLTVPFDYAEALNARNRSIVADYDAGMGMLDLIQKYRRTERQLRTILNQPLDDRAARPGAVDDRQQGLF